MLSLSLNRPRKKWPINDTSASVQTYSSGRQTYNTEPPKNTFIMVYQHNYQVLLFLLSSRHSQYFLTTLFWLHAQYHPGTIYHYFLIHHQSEHFSLSCLAIFLNCLANLILFVSDRRVHPQ